MKRLFKAIALVGLLITAPVRAFAEPISATLAAINTFAAASAFNAFVVRFATGVILSALGSIATKKKAGQQAGGGIRTEATTGGASNAQTFVLGAYATAGNMAAPPYSHPNSGSVPNKYLTYVLDVSDFPIQGLRRLIVNGEYLTISAESGDLAFKAKEVGGNYLINFNFHDGRQVAADPYMLSTYGDHPERPWAVDMVGAGVAYLVLRFEYNAEVFNGLPSVRAEVEGLRLYDPRFDDTVGGAGAQRWDDPDGWAFTENPIVMVYNILRGIALPGGGVWGGDATAADLPLANWFTAMNACDQPIGIAGGGFEPQFRAGLEVSLSDQPADVIGDLLAACSAEIVEIGGIFKVRVGGPGVPAYVFTDREILVDGPRRLMPHPGLDGVFNGIEARFPSPDALWETDDAPARYSAAWEAEDGGRRLVASVDLPAVPFPRQVQRLMQSWIRDARRFRQHSIALPPSAAVLEPLDAVAWSSVRHGYTGKIFEVGEISDDFGSLAQAITMRERDAGDTVWDPNADEIQVDAPSIGVVAPAPISLTGYGVAGVTIDDASGIPRRSAIHVTWAPDDFAFLSWAVFRAEDSAGNVVASVMVSDFSAGSIRFSEGIIGGEVYTITPKLEAIVPVVNPPAMTVTAPIALLLPSEFDPTVTDFIEDISGRSISALELENINIIEQDDQAPGWAGDLVGAVSAVKNGILYVQEAVLGAGVVYTDSTPFDLVDVYPVRIKAGMGAEFWNVSQSWFDWGVWADRSTWAGAIAGCAARAQVRTTLDDPADPVAVWSDWGAPSTLLVKARGVQTRFLLSFGSADHRARVTYGTTVIDVPDRMFSERGVAVPDTGLDFVFSPAFRDVPVVVATLVDPADGDRLKISSETAGGVRIDVVDGAGAGVPGAVNIHAKGYGRKEVTT